MLMKLAVHSAWNLEKSLDCLGQETFIRSLVILRHRLLHCVQLVQAGMSFHLRMHIFPSQSFKYNYPYGGMCSYVILWQVRNGWITTELFYGWLANHFALPIPPGRPVVYWWMVIQCTLILRSQSSVKRIACCCIACQLLWPLETSMEEGSKHMCSTKPWHVSNQGDLC